MTPSSSRRHSNARASLLAWDPLPACSCATLGKVLNLSVPRASHSTMGAGTVYPLPEYWEGKLSCYVQGSLHRVGGGIRVVSVIALV